LIDLGIVEMFHALEERWVVETILHEVMEGWVSVLIGLGDKLV